VSLFIARLVRRVMTLQPLQPASLITMVSGFSLCLAVRCAARASTTRNCADKPSLAADEILNGARSAVVLLSFDGTSGLVDSCPGHQRRTAPSVDHTVLSAPARLALAVSPRGNHACAPYECRDKNVDLDYALSPVHTSNNVKATLSNAASRTILSTKSNEPATSCCQRGWCGRHCRMSPMSNVHVVFVYLFTSLPVASVLVCDVRADEHQQFLVVGIIHPTKVLIDFPIAYSRRKGKE